MGSEKVVGKYGSVGLEQMVEKLCSSSKFSDGF